MDSSTKRQILKTIYEVFSEWTDEFNFACDRGCSVCCTQDVMATRTEAALLLDYILDEHGRRWLEKKLSGQLLAWPLLQTTNEYAAACLAGKDTADNDRRRSGVCPFLDHDICSVYPARPFSCRCFASTRLCRSDSTAVLPPHYLSAATALSQVIEHLGQFEPWGNMLDLLFLLAPPTVTSESGENHPTDQGDARLVARSNCLTARPLPGFLVEEKDGDAAARLLDGVFKRRIGSRTIEALLNNQ
jgi:Fe-S-cluster containining protein